MEFKPIKIPTAIPLRPPRPPQKDIPQTRGEREFLFAAAREYMTTLDLVPPIPFEDLKQHADKLIAELGVEPTYRDFLGVIMNNESWREQLAKVPFNKRLLLVPVCLRVENDCPAPFDEFGLLCKQCGKCSIHYLKEEAERLGYAMLVAEGTPIVLKLIETGQIEAVVGVSCLNVLERVFPYMESAAAPGIAIPLLQDDCADTNIDIEWLWEIIHLTSDDQAHRMNLDHLREEVSEWFSPESLEEIAGSDVVKDPTGAIAYEWLAKDGKRWRPFLTACAYQAYQEDPTAPLPQDLKKLAVAVECFHKASLIHDDIEDEDVERYGESTMHEEYGVAIALNVGDFMLGEGYRLIAECNATDEVKTKMLHIAALGHRTLSVGQGAELNWSRHPEPMTSRTVLDIFRKKTAPAFEVALHIGAVFGGADEETQKIIREYSEYLGIAYQIRDDLDDIFGEDSDSNDARDVRPSLLLALAHERAKGTDKELFTSIWNKTCSYEEHEERIKQVITELEIEERATKLMEGYQDEAVRTLSTMKNATLKGLLRRVITRIFDNADFGSFCNEFKTGNAPSRETVAGVTGRF